MISGNSSREHGSLLLGEALAGSPSCEPEIELEEFRLERGTPGVQGWLGTSSTATPP
jgi:hypothetical protein